jgi:hypothetical protein
LTILEDDEVVRGQPANGAARPVQNGDIEANDVHAGAKSQLRRFLLPRYAVAHARRNNQHEPNLTPQDGLLARLASQAVDPCRRNRGRLPQAEREAEIAASLPYCSPVRILTVGFIAAGAASLAWFHTPGGLAAQTDVAPQAPVLPTIFVDASVVDDSGRPVTTLRPEDVRVIIARILRHLGLPADLPAMRRGRPPPLVDEDLTP